MLHPSTKRLIDKLNDMTRKQRVAWTEGENATVVHDTEGYRVVLTPEPHAVLLTDALGREIETCLPEEFADEVDAHGRPYSKFVAELYREASRHARGTEKAISTLLAGLDAMVEPEPQPEPKPEPAPPVVPAGPDLELSDAVTDETAPLESETDITAAVATLADRINTSVAAAPETVTEVSEPEPEPEAAPEPQAESAAEPADEAPVPEPEPAPAANFAAPPAEAAPPEPEPTSFGTFGAFETEHPAEPAPPAAAAAEPEPEPAQEPEPEPEPEPVPQAAAQPEETEPQAEPVAAEPSAPTVPRLTQPISLSAIPFGFGLGAAQRTGAPQPEPKPEPAPQPDVQAEPPKRIVIDGTIDLPESVPAEFQDEASTEPYPPPEPKTGPQDIQGDTAPATEPGNVRRFNPWN